MKGRGSDLTEIYMDENEKKVIFNVAKRSYTDTCN